MSDMHAFYEALKFVYGPSHQVQALLRSSDVSNLQTEKRSYPQALVRAFRRPLQRLLHCAGAFTGQESPSRCKAGT